MSQNWVVTIGKWKFQKSCVGPPFRIGRRRWSLSQEPKRSQEQKPVFLGMAIPFLGYESDSQEHLVPGNEPTLDELHAMDELSALYGSVKKSKRSQRLKIY